MKTVALPAALAASLPSIHLSIIEVEDYYVVRMTFAHDGQRWPCEFTLDNLEELGPRVIAEQLAARMENRES